MLLRKVRDWRLMTSGLLANLDGRWRWLLWAGYVAAWSYAILSPLPVTVADEMIADDVLRFLAFKSLHIGAYAGQTILTGWLPLARKHLVFGLVFMSFHAFATE